MCVSEKWTLPKEGGTQKGGATDSFGCWNPCRKVFGDLPLTRCRMRDGNAGRAAVDLQPCLLAETLYRRHT